MHTDRSDTALSDGELPLAQCKCQPQIQYRHGSVVSDRTDNNIRVRVFQFTVSILPYKVQPLHIGSLKFENVQLLQSINDSCCIARSLIINVCYQTPSILHMRAEDDWSLRGLLLGKDISPAESSSATYFLTLCFDSPICSLSSPSVSVPAGSNSLSSMIR